MLQAGGDLPANPSASSVKGVSTSMSFLLFESKRFTKGKVTTVNPLYWNLNQAQNPLHLQMGWLQQVNLIPCFKFEKNSPTIKLPPSQRCKKASVLHGIA